MRESTVLIPGLQDIPESGRISLCRIDALISSYADASASLDQQYIFEPLCGDESREVKLQASSFKLQGLIYCTATVQYVENAAVFAGADRTGIELWLI